MATLVCVTCGRSVDVKPASIRAGRRYCSTACKAASQRTRPTPGKVEVACLECGTTFLCPKAWAREGRRKFCDRTCRNRHQAALTGEKSPRFGRTHTKASREKMAESRQAVSPRGPAHPQWKGGRMTTGDGYIKVMIDALPPEQMALARAMRPTQVYILEHRLVMAATLGRPLEAKEVVHHKNGIKSDNSPENLTLMDWGPHSRKHRHVERQLASALAEIERLKSLLATYQTGGSDTST
jgi:hypothetical protein